MTINEIVAKSKVAQQAYAHATQEQADAACKAILKVVYDNAEKFGPMAAEESRMGDVQAKITKCRTKSSLIWEDMKDKKSCDIISYDDEKKMYEVAKPVGVVASIIPSTNPVVTPMSNGAWALKCRNSIIYSPHPRAVQCCNELVALFRAELAKLGLPEDLVQVVEEVSIEASAELMSACDLVIATGGNDMVKSAYSSGKPAIGVGQGNVQTIIDVECDDIEKAVADIVLGRSFDNGLICLGEQCLHAPAAKMDEVKAALAKAGAFLIEDEATKDALREMCFPGGGAFSRFCVGENALQLAERLNIEVPADTKVLIAEVDGIAEADVLCREKLCPVMGLASYETFEEGIANMVANLNFEGRGHSVGVHSNNKEHIEYAAIMCDVSRVIVNQPSGTNGGGAMINSFIPTTTLGCGTWGNNAFAGNLSYTQFLNITRVGLPLDKPWIDDVAKAWED